jgi:hypothetical protein
MSSSTRPTFLWASPNECSRATSIEKSDAWGQENSQEFADSAYAGPIFDTALDETVLSADPAAFEREIVWRAMTAPQDHQGRTTALANLVRLAAYRAFHQKDPDVLSREFLAFAQGVRRLTESSRDLSGLRPYALGTLSSAIEGWCSIHARFAVAVLSSGEPDQDAGEAPFWEAFAEAYRDGDPALLSPTQDLARIALEELARLRPMSALTMKELDSIIRRPGADVSRTTPAVLLLHILAPLQKLPKTLTDAMAHAMGATGEDNKFSALAAFVLLAANGCYLEPEISAKVMAWTDGHLEADRTLSILHEGLGYLARPGFFPKAYENLLVSRLSPASRFEPRATNYLGETIINATSDQAVVSLGRAALVGELSESVLERLANVIAARPMMPGRQVVVEGLSQRRYAGADDFPQAVLDRLRGTRLDAIMRSLEVEIASARLAKLLRSGEGHLVDMLLAAWRLESEPEVRIAIGQIIGTAAVVEDGASQMQRCLDCSPP